MTSSSSRKEKRKPLFRVHVLHKNVRLGTFSLSQAVRHGNVTTKSVLLVLSCFDLFFDLFFGVLVAAVVALAS